MKKILIIIAVIIVLGIAAAIANTPDLEPVASGQAIEAYVSENISTLSPVKEQLGGKFFVTDIEAHGGAGTVSYEDGHNAYTADFTYAVDEAGAPAVTSFEIRGQ